jgi:long-chain fatty acid transport protein
MSKRTPIIILAAVLILASLAAANGLNLNGLGTRAQAMGGAYVGIADDFSAVFWNPAGAAGFRKEMFGFYATDLMPRATFRQWPLTLEVPEIDAKTPTQHYLGFLGAYYRPIGSKVVVGIGVGTPSGLGVKWDGADFADLSDDTTFDWSSKIGAFSISPLVAVKLNDWLSVGASVDLRFGMFNLKMAPGLLELDGSTYQTGQYEENMDGWGFGATFGVLAKPVEKLTIGLTVRTPSTVSLKGTARMSYLTLYGLPDSSDLERELTWPLWIAGGVAFRPIERLVLSADVHWTQWSKLDRLTTVYLEDFWARLMAEGDRDVRVLNWKDAAQIRFGAEYALSATTALRAGYYNDPAPGLFNTMNPLLPTHTYNAFSLGVGKTIGDLHLDFGLEYLAGKDRTNDSGFVGTSYGMSIVVPSVSVSYTF